MRTALDLFSGCGGLSLGLEQAGFKVVGAIELDQLAAETYAMNHQGGKLWVRDIRKVPVLEVMRELGLAPGELDLLAGCPPCQGFSTLTTLNGKHRMRDERNDLVLEFLRFIRGLRPKAVMMENVPGLIRNTRSARLRKELHKLGYSCEMKVLNAKDFGVPQRRRRFVLMAVKGKNVQIDFAPCLEKEVTVREALGTLKGRTRRDQLHHMLHKPSAKVLTRIQRIPKDGGSRNDLGRRYQLDCHKRNDGFKDIYGRMHWDKPSPTITGGCFNPSKGRFLHPSKDRPISMREAAVLQSFPVDYKFSTRRGKIAVAQMIGNALPPEFIRRQAVHLIELMKR